MAVDNKDAKVAGVFSLGAAITAALAYLESKKKGEFILPDEVVQLLIALAATSDDIKKILESLAAAGITVQGWPANANSITSLRVAINPATGMQLPSIFVPSGMALVIKAYALNPAWLWVGASAAEAGNLNQAFPLLPSETVSYQVENADEIYVAAMTVAGVATAGCFACLTVEQRRGGG